MKRFLSGFLVVLCAAAAVSSPIPREIAAGVGGSTTFVLQDGTVVEKGATALAIARVPADLVAVTGWEDARYGLGADGSVVAWSATQTPTVRLATSTDPVVSIVATDTGVLALRKSGRLVAAPVGGQPATEVLGVPALIAISARGANVLAVDVDHRAWTWTGASEQALAAGLPAVATVAVGVDHSVAVDLDGGVWTWSKGDPQRLGVGGMTSVAAGDGFDVAIATDGSVWTWGSNVHGQLGDNTRTPRTTPARVEGLVGAVAVSAGDNHAIVTLADGSIWGFGENGDGQLPDGGEAVDRLVPTRLSGSKTNRVAAPRANAAAGLLSLATDTPKASIHYTLDGGTPTEASEEYTTPISLPEGSTLKARGFKPGLLPSDLLTKPATALSGRLVSSGAFRATETAGAALAAPAPAALQSVGAVVAGGVWHSIAALPNGTAWAWGSNGNGQLGVGSLTPSAVPLQVAGLVSTKGVAAGQNHSVAVKNDATVWVWGNNNQGQLGTGTPTQQMSPVQLAGLANVVSVAAGWYYSVALKGDGTLWVWGANGAGQLGLGDTTQRGTPVQVPGLSGVTAVAAGEQHTLALKSDGTVWAWGSNISGQLGDGSTATRLTPTKVDGISGAVGVSAGRNHSLVARNDGTAWGWGLNANGQLGDGTTLNRLTPVQVAGMTNVAQVAAGESHSLALRNDETVWSWGSNASGQLGDGTTTQRLLPVQAAPLSGAAFVAAGANHSLAVTSDLSIWAWGNNGSTQIGDGTGENRLRPVRVSDPNFVWRVATPTITPVSGSYTVTQNATIACSTPSAVIRYTTNGTDPTATSTLYSAAVPITATTTLKAKAFKTGLNNSNTAVAVYTLVATAPTMSPAGGAYTTSQNVALATTTPGATIRYTTDGSTPTPTSTAYTTAIPVSTNITLKAAAFKTGWTDSAVASAGYTFNFGTAPAPTVTPVAGTYVGSVTVSVSAIAGATIRYTTDGTDPYSGSPLYSSPIVLTQTTTFKAKTFHPNYGASLTTTVIYTVQAAAPVLSPGSGSYTAGQQVVVTGPAGATLRYTLNGVAPTATDTAIASGSSLTLTSNVTIKVQAFQTNLTPSAVTTGAYTITGTTAAPGTLAAGPAHSFAANTAGTVWGWGFNGNGELGVSTPTNLTTPTSLAGFSGATALASGLNHSLARKTTGAVWASGLNGSGQLGNNSTTSSSVPVQSSGLVNMTAVAAGANHSVALKSDGTVWTWGLNSSGQLGNNSTTNSLVPIQVSGLVGMTAVAAGANHSLALKSDGTVWAWGLNASGQIGNGLTTNSLVPVQVSGLAGATAIAGGDNHSVALLTDGTVRAWGANSFGQVGDATNVTPRTTPATVAILNTVVRIAAGNGFTLAVRRDGTVWSWGTNGSGQLGDGTVNPRNTPGQVLGLSNVALVSAGASHALALQWDGGVWGWGLNTSRQVGDGTTINRLLAVRIAGPNFGWLVATPVLSQATGTFYADTPITVTCATAGATLRYTKNGVDPVATDPIVASGATVLVDQSMTLKVKAFKAGSPDSAIAVGTYTTRVFDVTLSPGSGTYFTAPSVALSTTTTGVTIRYTIDGTDPTATSPVYTGPIPVGATQTISAKGFRAGWQDGGRTFANYTLKVATPTLAPPPTSYATAQTVTISSATPGAVIRYTTTGREPTESSPTVVSGGTVAIARSSTLMVKAWGPSGWTISDTVSGTYVIGGAVLAAPTIAPAGGTYTTPQTVTMTGPTGAVIRYTTDGTDPTLWSRVYSTSLLIDATATLKAKAFMVDLTPSATTTMTYTFDPAVVLASPVFSPAPGRYTTARTVTLSSPSAGTTIRYTTTGMSPVPADPTVLSGGTLVVDRETPLSAQSEKSGVSPSSVRRGLYEITGAISSGNTFGTSSHFLALKTNGTVWSWGDNLYGQVGDGTTTARAVPVQLSSLSGVVAIATGAYHSLALKSDGSVWAWGFNTNGQLGNNSTTNSSVPVQVSGLAGVTSIAAGAYHSLAVKSDGTAWAWGFNNVGQLGNGGGIDRTTPVQVSGLTGVAALSGGALHSVALKTDGTVWAWGRNASGTLGDGTQTNSSVPVNVVGLSGVSQIAAGDYHTAALRTDGDLKGSVWVWGNNSTSQVGDGTTVDRLRPVRVLDSAITVSAKTNQTEALVVDQSGRATLWAWGYHGGGELFGTLASSAPAHVAPGDFALIAAGAGDSPSSLAATRDGRVYIWGHFSDRLTLVLTLGSPATNADVDADGLLNSREIDLGTDPFAGDTNGDGLLDGVAVSTNRDTRNPDVDGDGLTNAIERQRGTDPFRPDTDGDGSLDGVDAFPLDPTRWQAPAPTPGDVTPPVITLTAPTNATLISSVPPQ